MYHCRSQETSRHLLLPQGHTLSSNQATVSPDINLWKRTQQLLFPSDNISPDQQGPMRHAGHIATCLHRRSLPSAKLPVPAPARWCECRLPFARDWQQQNSSCSPTQNDHISRGGWACIRSWQTSCFIHYKIVFHTVQVGVYHIDLVVKLIIKTNGFQSYFFYHDLGHIKIQIGPIQPEMRPYFSDIQGLPLPSNDHFILSLRVPFNQNICTRYLGRQ